MIDPEPVLKARLRWVKHYQQSQNAALSCRRCGISKGTLLKWWRRYQNEGEAGLLSQSRRPHKLRKRKVTPEHETLVLDRRQRRHLVPKVSNANCYASTNCDFRPAPSGRYCIDTAFRFSSP